MSRPVLEVCGNGLVDTRPSFDRIMASLRIASNKIGTVEYPPSLPVKGFTTVLTALPRVEVHEDVLFVPGDKGGLFDRGRRLIAGSGYYRSSPDGPEAIELAHGRPVSPIDPDTVDRFVDEEVAFGGVILPQFGHFLVGSLSRFWNADLRRLPQLVINLEEPSSFFKPPFMADCFRALGIGPGQFRRYAEPVRLRRVVVPYPAFEEGNIAHLAYGRMCDEIAMSVEPVKAHGGPVFLTRAALRSGIAQFVNEAALCDAMGRRGFEIVSPETLPFSEQVSLFRSRPAVAGLMGSAMHVSAFASGCRIVAVSNPIGMQSNQILIDKAAGNRARYLYDPAYFASADTTEGFSVAFWINDPERLADDIVRALD